MKHLYLTLLSLMTMLYAGASSADITGRVCESDSIPVEFATVTLLQLPDSVYVAGAVSDASGLFRIEMDNSVKSILRVEAYGYKDAIVPVSGQDMLIKLTPLTNELNEVVVTGKAPVIKSEAGKFVIIPNELTKLATDGFNLLAMAPMTSVSEDRIDILGKSNCKLYINGKEPKETQAAVVTRLRELPPQYIKSIELITSPGAREAADFSGGIVNVIIDDPREGLIGFTNIKLKYTNNRPSTNATLLIGTNYGKLSTATTLSYQNENALSRSETNYYYPLLDKSVFNSAETHTHANGLTLGFTAEYALKTNMDLGAALFLGGGQVKTSSYTSTVTRENGVEKPSYFSETNRQPFSRPNVGGTLFYSWRTDSKGSELNVRADYASSIAKNNLDQYFDEEVIIDNRSNSAETFKVKADYTHIFTDHLNLAVGYHLYATSRHDRRDYNLTPDDFHYQETINAAYAQADWTINKQMSLAGGVRYEYTHYNSFQEATNENYSRNYSNIIPNLSFNINLPHKQSLSIDFSPHISRPYYEWLNPYKNWTSDNSYTVGNPYLKTQTVWTINLYYRFLQGFALSVYGSSSKNAPIEYILNESDGTAVRSYDNNGTNNNACIKLQYSKYLFNLWQIKTEVSADYSNCKAIALNQNIGYVTWDGRFELGNYFRLSRKHGLTGSFLYRLYTPFKNTYSERSWKQQFWIEATKSFRFGGALSLTAFIPIGTRTNTYSTDQFAYRQHNLGNNFDIYLSFRYVFGKKTVRSTQYQPNDADISR